MADNSDKMLNISCLPTEILSTIFCKLSTKDRGRCALVSVDWRDMCYQKQVWRDVRFEWKRHVIMSNYPTLVDSLVTRGIRRVSLDVVDAEPSTLLDDICLAMTNLHSLSVDFRPDTDKFLCSRFCFSLYIRHSNIIKLTVPIINGHLKNLVRLQIYCCCKDDLMEAISTNLTMLTHLTIMGCMCLTRIGINYLTGRAVDVAKCRPKLEYLKVTFWPGLSDEVLEYLSIGQPRLKHLILAGRMASVFSKFSISDAGMKHLTNFVDLQELHLLHSSNVTAIGFNYLVSIPKLQVLHLVRIGEVGLQHLSKMANLRRLGLHDSRCSFDTILRVLVQIPSSRQLELDLSGLISDGDLKSLAESMPYLSGLELFTSNLVTDDGIRNISQIPGLRYLLIDRCSKVNVTSFAYLHDESSKIIKLDAFYDRRSNRNEIIIFKKMHFRIARISTADTSQPEIPANLFTVEQHSYSDCELQLCSYAKLPLH